MKWIFKSIDLQVYRKSVTETIFLHLRCAGRNISSHVNSLQMDIQSYVRTKVETIILNK